MPKINDGGSAFPKQPVYKIGGAEISLVQDGMTLRDWYAGQALAGLAAAHTSDGQWAAIGAAEEAAEFAYHFADAMIAARSKGGDNA